MNRRLYNRSLRRAWIGAPAFVAAAQLAFVAAVLTVEPLQADDTPAGTPYAEILVVDVATGRGVPLVQLTTVNQQKFVTDNAGRIAFHEPELMNREVWFTVAGHGYEVDADGFGFRGVRITPVAGKVHRVEVHRKNIAERLCRLTGMGRYRDTVLLGHKPPFDEAAHSGGVVGQDSVQAVEYRGRIVWFWGDTNRASYILGLFRTAGAITDRFGPDFSADAGIPFRYFTDDTGFARAMIPHPSQPEGVIWIEGLCVVPDASGRETLVAHYTRRKGLVDELEHGIAVYDDATDTFLPTVQRPLTDKWRFPVGHPEKHAADGRTWLLSGNSCLTVRVPATLEAVLDPRQYEAYTCLANADETSPRLNTDPDGSPAYRWQSEFPPITSEGEAKLVAANLLKPQHTRFLPADASRPERRVQLHNGSIRWNAYRGKWITLAPRFGGDTSALGDVWYSEADEQTGPFRAAVKVLLHDKQTFYNVCQHTFLDRGRYIYFEGTYTNSFSGNTEQTPRYDYNQVLYRLDLDAEGLKPLR
jgi:hypothetical protein